MSKDSILRMKMTLLTMRNNTQDLIQMREKTLKIAHKKSMKHVIRDRMENQTESKVILKSNVKSFLDKEDKYKIYDSVEVKSLTPINQRIVQFKDTSMNAKESKIPKPKNIKTKMTIGTSNSLYKQGNASFLLSK